MSDFSSFPQRRCGTGVMEWGKMFSISHSLAKKWVLDRFFCQSSDTLTVSYILVVAVYCVRRKSMKYTFLFPQFSHFQERGRGEERRRRQTNTSIRGKEGERPLYYPLVPSPSLWTRADFVREANAKMFFCVFVKFLTMGGFGNLGKRELNAIQFCFVWSRSPINRVAKSNIIQIWLQQSPSKEKKQKEFKKWGNKLFYSQAGLYEPYSEKGKMGRGKSLFSLSFLLISLLFSGQW